MAQEILKINGVYMGSQEIASTRYTPSAYYRFSTGALTTDSTTGGHTLTAISDPAEDASGKFGGAVALDGNDAYSATDHADFKPTSAFTVGGWIKTSTTADYQFIFQSYSANTNIAGFRMYLNQTAGNIIFFSGKNSGTSSGTDYQYIINSVNLADGNWHFAVGVWDGSYLKLYVDGISAATPVSWANAPAYAATNYVRIGCSNNTGTNAQFFTGSLDDIFLLNGTALTPDEIYSLYKTGVKKLNGQVNLNPEFITTSIFPDTSNKAYYRFESGALTTDSSGNSHTLTAISDPAETTGKFGGAVDLDSTDAYSITDHADFKPTGAFSVGGWVKSPTTGATRLIFQSYASSGGASGGFLMFIHSTNVIWFESADNTGTTENVDYDNIKGATNVCDGNWHQFVATWDTTSLNLYIDGRSDATAVAWANAPGYKATNYVRIGCYNVTGSDSLFLTGQLDDMFVLNGKALSATEISNLYNTNIKKYNQVSNV